MGSIFAFPVNSFSLCCCQTSIINVRTNVVEPSRASVVSTSTHGRRLFKMLLLGPAESGKTTFIKQMQILHLDGFTSQFIESRKSIIYSQTKQNMLAIVNAMFELGIEYKNVMIEADAELLERHVAEGRDHEPLSDDVIIAIKNLCSDEGIQECFSRKDEFQLPDSAKYFFENIDRIAEADYIPTNQDILQLRVQTIGVNNIEFSYNDSDFRTYDAGGQRAQRRKWIHFFDDIHAMIFIAAISEYNQRLKEDKNRHRILETLDLFKDVANHNAFVNAGIILFLNKIDIFQEKIKNIPLKNYFRSFKGEDDYHQAIGFIKAKFKRRYKNKSPLYIFETCATNTDHINTISQSVFKLIRDKHAKNIGLMK